MIKTFYSLLSPAGFLLAGDPITLEDISNQLDLNNRLSVVLLFVVAVFLGAFLMGFLWNRFKKY